MLLANKEVLLKVHDGNRAPEQISPIQRIAQVLPLSNLLVWQGWQRGSSIGHPHTPLVYYSRGSGKPVEQASVFLFCSTPRSWSCPTELLKVLQKELFNARHNNCYYLPGTVCVCVHVGAYVCVSVSVGNFSRWRKAHWMPLPPLFPFWK